MTKIFFYLSLLLMSITSQAQTNLYQYNDTEIKTGTYAKECIRIGDRMIVAGRSFVTEMNQPAIVCLDADGNTIWNTAETDTTQYIGISVLLHLVADNDGYIYAAGRKNGEPEYWKVDAATGEIIWKKTFSGFYNDENNSIIDYDPTKFLIAYVVANSSEKRFSFLSKATGDMLTTHTMGMYSSQTIGNPLSIDSDKNIYYGRGDSLFKLSAANPDIYLWRKKHASLWMANYRAVHYDISLSKLFFFVNTASNTGAIVEVDPVNGQLLNSYGNGSLGGGLFEELRIQGNNLFMTWSHLLVGGSGSYTHAMKFDMAAGAWLWSALIDMSEDEHEAAHALEVDAAGNVFLTGYSHDANYGPGNWTILKLDGTTGDTIYTRTVEGEHPGIDWNSEGTGLELINDVPCFIGNLQSDYYSGDVKMTFIRLSNTSGATEIQKTIGGAHPFESKTVAIEPYGSNKTMVLKQVGRSLKLEMYDTIQQLLWTRHLTSNYYLLGAHLTASPNGTIYVSAAHKPRMDEAPFYLESNWSDSIFVYQLNGSGTILETYRFSNGNPTGLHADNSGAKIFYVLNNYVSYRNIIAQTLSQEYNTGMIYQSLGAETRNYWDQSTAKGYWFTPIGGTNSVVELDKTNNNWTPTVMYPAAFSRVNHLEPIDADRTILCGKSSAQQEIIAVFSTVTMDTVWMKQIPGSTSQMIRCLIDPDQQFIYTMASGGNDIIVRKLSLATGLQAWSYTHDGAASASDFPIDIAYDNFRDQLIIAGYETDANNQTMPVSLVFDTAGTLLSAITLPNELAGNGKAVCTHVLPDGAQWVGGSRMSTAFGPTGFIMETEGAIPPPCVPVEIVVSNSFSIPSDVNSCTGAATISLTGLPDFTLDFNSGGAIYSSGGYSLITDLCPGIHSVLITDDCGDSLSMQLIIPVDSNYVYTNPFIDSLAVDSLSFTTENCIVFYNSIDSAYIDSVFATGNTVTVIWNVVDSNGPHADTATYELNNGNGVYVLQLNIFCPTKILGEFFTVTQAIYYSDGAISLSPGSTAGTMELSSSGLVIYPNPANSMVTMVFPSDSAFLTIYDLDGKMVHSQLVTSNEQVSLETMLSGIYFFELRTSDFITTKRVIKQ